MARCRDFGRFFLGLVPQDVPLRIMDLGCATGDQLFYLAGEMPRAHFTGIDISTQNIDAARQQLANFPGHDRITFVARDYLGFASEPFDVIYSWSTLHLIPAPTNVLFGKIVRDLVPGGLLVYVIPYECSFNMLLMMFRRFVRFLPDKPLDQLFLKAALVIHGAHMSREQLQERLVYMRILPDRMHGPQLKKALEKLNLSLLLEQKAPHASIAQPKHIIAVYQKK